ncbi:MAG: hypothetical protein FGM40_01580 [Rhodocyclaceae bacterium]|nr:hypothetical protein [Rhodocyclaceae bacterium]
MIFHRLRHIVAALPVVLATPALAAEEAAAPPDWTITTNIGVFNQYFFRGVGYTRGLPAVQGGADVAHSSGFYAGIWGSNVYEGAISNANVEIDVYGGFAKSFGDFGIDVGVLQFIFPGSSHFATADGFSPGSRGKSLNTTELYAAGSWKFFQLKYSRAVTDYFGLNNTEGSNYLEGNINYEFLPSWTLNLHVGRQTVEDPAKTAGFTDYKAGVTKTFESGWQVGAAYIDVSANPASFIDYGADLNKNPKSLIEKNYLLFVKRVF